jgi:hypothetical protein
MAEPTFREFLHNIRVRTKGTKLAKAVGISYVYLLDLEKGARPVPSNTVLLSLADNLSFSSGEREKFFDLAAAEKGEVPIDIATFICENQDLINIIRQIKKEEPNKALRDTLSQNISAKIGEQKHGGK